ncbi:unnamed protein product [Prorocentrum cordatum]|uniref:Uncharacterized protein n=1 Tax=Prorocentrum cordatum TaxID=2364126 RepID=A0ABN9V6M1_9DINO|nr:unnamed protein product [Polarella glacialis]
MRCALAWLIPSPSLRRAPPRALLMVAWGVCAASLFGAGGPSCVGLSLGMLDGSRASRTSASSTSSLAAAIKKCGSRKQWSTALELYRDACHRRLPGSSDLYTSTASACGRGTQWQRALSLLREAWGASLEPDVV